MGDNFIEITIRFSQRAAFGRNVAVMERIEWRTDFREELKRRIHADFRDGDRVFPFFPRADNCAGAKRVGADAAKRVPIGDREPHVALQGHAVDDFLRIVVPESQGILGLGALEPDGGNAEVLAAGILRHSGG